MKKKNAKIIVATAIVTPVALFCIAGFSCGLNVVNYKVQTEKVTKPFRIVMISDLHGSVFGESQIDLINAIKAQKPDIIMFAGDIFVEDMPRSSAVMLLEGISNLCPCYFSYGNHEYLNDKVIDIKQILRTYGVETLDENEKEIIVNGQKISVCGLKDPFAGQDEFNRSLKKVTEFKSNNYSILLSHHAEFADAYKKMNFDLILTGHAHGGQWRIPYLLNGLYAPEQGFFPKNAGGVYKYNNTVQIVGRGLTKYYIVPRIFNPPELVVINVEPK